MGAYSVFAEYYDELTGNADYSRRAEYILKLLERLGRRPGLTLDLACGTGSLVLELRRRGVDVYGVDASPDMLSQARMKCAEAGEDVLFLCQKLQELDLYGTADTMVCTLDSLNHLPGRGELQRALARVSLFLEPGGWFLFDMNTPCKHERVLGNNTFVYDMPDVYCVWQNHFTPQTCKVDVRLDFFARRGKAYHRSSEHFAEWAYPEEAVESMLTQAGFGELHVYDELTFDPPRPDSQRLMYAARKIPKT